MANTHKGGGYPPIGFNFSVSASANGSNTSSDAWFQRVSGIGARRSYTEVVEGGLNNTVYHLPAGIRYDNLILERGLVPKNSDLGAWYAKSLMTQTGPIQTRVVIVTLFDYDSKTPTLSWSFYNAYPVRWMLSDFRSDQSVLAIETIELAYSHFESMK